MPISYIQLVVLGGLASGDAVVLLRCGSAGNPFQHFEFQNKYVWLIIPEVLFFFVDFVFREYDV